MTAQNGFVWFLPVYVSMKINDTGLQDVNGSCTEGEMRSAIDGKLVRVEGSASINVINQPSGHFALSYAPFGNDSDEIEGSQTIAQWKEKYLSETKMNKTQFSDYAGFAYDAIWVYVKALQQMIKEGKIFPFEIVQC